ncbi:MAG TPA: ECF-type sigma factor [Candidatus Acidoferrales bacterium]|nr:ECF-type sigma factor [Candidatus Acidoferrales bacterium]
MFTDDITGLLARLPAEGAQGWDRLAPLVYRKLRSIAAVHLRNRADRDVLQPTALVHETYLRLARQRKTGWRNRVHFFSAAAHLMRLIMLDHARRRNARAAVERAYLEVQATGGSATDGRALSRALDKLAGLDERQARIVELRFFAGLTVEQAADALGISPKTVKRDWAVARAWLHAELNDSR